MERPITLTEETIQEMHDIAVKDPNSIFVLKSFSRDVISTIKEKESK